MSKEVLAVASHSYEMATYSTPELRNLFNDWMGAIEEEIVDFLRERETVNPDEVAVKFRLKKESIIFILGKLAAEGKIIMQASGPKATT
jgi:hypothetical protein